jgi:hypothetical protein
MTHYDIAKIIHNKWMNELKCTTGRNNWYQLVNNQWIKINMHDIITDIINDYNILFVKYNNLANNSKECCEKDEFICKAQEYFDIANKLNNNSYRDNVIKECKTLFYDPDFKNINNKIL